MLSTVKEANVFVTLKLKQSSTNIKELNQVQNSLS